MRNFFCLILLASFCSCGFQIIYRDEDNKFSYAEDLASIRIKKDRDQESIGLMIYVARDFIKSLPSDSKLRSKIADLLSSGKIFANL